MVALALFGGLAGLLTTVAGAGGGMMLVLGLGAWWGDPVRALAVATPALLVGNLHRAVLYRRELPRHLVGPWVAGAMAGALAGGLLAVRLPPVVLQAAMVGAALAAVVTHLRRTTVVRARAGWLGPAGLAVGLASTAGGAGLLANPVLQAAGLRGGAYLAALSAGGVAMHVGRLIGMGAGGGLSLDVVPMASVLAVTIPLGNLLGRRVRGWLSEERTARVEVASMVALVSLSLAGLL
ncbi:MAG: TSUP family transporter [Alphaproteobacteria bacterium]|nr:TSUP family transporter [Alphaproteobacteria bacterium]MCB9698577.1 TSUP family transporter [Alphaproteobacteria bacterium]